MRQEAVQTPQPLHRTVLTTAQPSSISTAMAPKGQLASQRPQADAAFLVDIGGLAFGLDEVLGQDRAGPRYGRIGLDDGLLAQLRGMGHAAHEYAVGGEIDGAQLHVGLEEEAVLVGRDLEHLADLFIFRVRDGARRSGPAGRP